MTSEHNKKFTHIIYIYTVYNMMELSRTIYEMTEGSDLTLSCGGALVLFLIDASRQGTWGTGSMCYSSGLFRKDCKRHSPCGQANGVSAERGTSRLRHRWHRLQAAHTWY